ncbi:MAG: ATP-dependent Clp protease adaptor ClpS [Anaerolineales bacterium]
MADHPAPAAPPEIETERGIRLDELPVAETELDPPYRVLIHNDDVTPFEFVIAVLRAVFHLSGSDALAVTTRAHYRGIAYVMTLAFEEAKHRVGQAHGLARSAGFPLTFSIEPE